MKKINVLFAAIIFSHSLLAQDFQETLKGTYLSFSETDSVSTIMAMANRFERIAAKWGNEWTAHYYAAYADVVLSYKLNDEKQRDAMIDKAGKAFAKVKILLGGDTDETLILEAYIANARLAVKPMSRYKGYGDIFDAKLEAASKINPQNPRIYFLKGQSTFHTPKAFGGGAKRALPYFEKAATLFAAETKDDLNKPFWGEEGNAYYLDECRK
jgi:hypothetical protein